MGKYTPKLPKAVIEFEVRDKDGKLIQKGKFPAKSWVGNIIGLLSCLVSGMTCTTSVSGYGGYSRTDLTDVGSTARGLFMGCFSGGSVLGGNAGAGVDTFGILIGTSDTPVALSQFALGAKITHGTGSGQMQYGASTVDVMVKNSSWYFRAIRTFTNGSGATITVREIGLFLRLPITNASDGYAPFMLARDVPASPINVPSGSTLTLRYIISHSLS
jgi:hypothetical protein